MSSSRSLQINAVGFNPVDNKTYGMLKYKIDTTAHSFFVRFDVFSIEYLGKMDLSYSGMVDRDGNFYFFSSSSKTLKKIKDAQLVTGVTTRANNHYIGASQLSSLSFQPLGTTVATRSNLSLSSVVIPLDIVQLFANIEGTRRATTLWATAARKKLLSFTTIPRATGRGRSMPPTRETPPVYRPLQRGRTGITRTRSLFRAIRDTASLKSSPPPSTLWPKRSRCAASGAPTRPATTTASTATRPLCRLPRVATKTDQTRSQTHTQS